MLEEIRNAIIITVHLDEATWAIIYSRYNVEEQGGISLKMQVTLYFKICMCVFVCVCVGLSVSQLNCSLFRYSCTIPDKADPVVHNFAF